MQDPLFTEADAVRHDLVALAFSIDTARDADAAWTAYSLARRRYYGAADADQADEGVGFAWVQVLAAYELKLDSFRTPIVPLVVFS